MTPEQTRRMPTSQLIRALAELSHPIVAGFPPQEIRAEERRISSERVAAEIDRRIPIPEGT